MIRNIDFGTVIISVIFSVITVRIMVSASMDEIIELEKEFLEQSKQIVIRTIKETYKR